MPLRAALARMRSTAASEMSTATTSRLDAGQRQREPAVVAEGVEHAAVRVPGGRDPVLALVEEQPGLLAVIRIDVVDDWPLAHLDRLGHRAVEDLDALLETLEEADPRVVSRQDAGRREQLDEQRRDLRQHPVGRLRQRLHHEVVAVAIDDQPRQQVRLAVHQPAGGGVEPERGAKLACLAETLPPHRQIRRRRGAGKQPQGDLRSIAVERVTRVLAAVVDDGDHVAGRRHRP